MSKLNCIEDWKNTDKINAIKQLIEAGQINQHNIGSFLGHKSKKTYSNGDIIDDASLACKKFMNPEIKEYNNKFYNFIDATIKPEIIVFTVPLFSEKGVIDYYNKLKELYNTYTSII